MVHLFKRFCLANLTPLIPIILLGYSGGTFARLADFQTTRLQSTGGAGAGSMLMDEATVLNPAPLAFFNVSSFYIQKTGVEISPERGSSPYSDVESQEVAVIASDGGGSLSGSLSYLKTSHGFDHRKRIGASGSYPLGKKSAMGVNLRITEDDLSINGKDYKQDKYKQIVVGFTHALNESFTMGIVFVDPAKEKQGDTKATIGFQYVYKDFISLMLDTGGDYSTDVEATMSYSAAAQLKILGDFFLRFGTFENRAFRERGNGVGLGWVQPKLAFNFAVKNSVLLDLPEKRQEAEKSKQTSFSLSYRF